MDEYCHSHTINISQQSHQIVLFNGLERNANNMTDKLSDRVIKPGDIRHEIGHSDFQPEQCKVTGLQYVRQVNDGLNGVIIHLSWQQ